MKAIFYILGLVIVLFLVKAPSPREQLPGILVPNAPLQEDLDPHERHQMQFMGYDLSYKARISLTARVLSKRRYHFFGHAKLLPYDLALGWRRMSDTDVLKHFKIYQSDRYYFWRYEGTPYIPTSEVIENSSNVHMIPRDLASTKILDKVREGDLIEVKGFLVDVTQNQQLVMKTSLSRTDSGSGACEVVFVEDIKIK